MKGLIISLVVLFSFISFCASSAIDNKRAKDKNIDIVQALYYDFAKGDIPAVLQRFDPKIEWNEAENFPYADGNPYVGPNAVVEGVFKRLGTEWDYWNLTEQKYYEAKNGDIIVTGRYKAKNKETGKIINAQFVHMWQLENGKVTRFQQSADKYQVVEAMKKNNKIMDNEQLISFGKKYADAWCSQKPENVAAFFASNGSLSVNANTPAIGRDAITKVAQGFMTTFPDMIVTMDSLVTKSNGIEFHWTLTGTNSGVGGTGNKVRISGFELWQFDKNGLISESKGSFDAEEYNKQLKYGVKN